jgi:hypothetical protein
MKRIEAAKSFVVGDTGQRLVGSCILKYLALALAAAWILTCKQQLYIVIMIIDSLGDTLRSSRLIFAFNCSRIPSTALRRHSQNNFFYLLQGRAVLCLSTSFLSYQQL